MGFSTYNESSLHNSLKTLYCSIYDGQTEVEMDGHVYDILTKNGNVVEIQTKNLTKLLPKILDTIDKGRNVKLVHPVVITRRILLLDEHGNKISNRKSPKRGCIYDIFEELTGIYPVLLNPHFSLEVVEIEMTEERVRTKHNVQSKNKRRRFRKNWNKTNKKLDKIINTRRFNSAKDYIDLLPKSLPQEFCAKDLEKELKKSKEFPSKTRVNAHLIIWVLRHMELIKETKVFNRSHYYSI